MSEMTKVLCVDDEPNILHGLKRQLRNTFEIHTAESGAQGLEVLSKNGPFPVVISDMRMPEMDGAQFLSQAKKQHPSMLGIILSGQSDMDAAIRAVNEGQIFRFLLKPCSTDDLTNTLNDAIENHRLREIEKELLEKTLYSSIKVLSEMLELVNPTAFSRVSRIKQYIDHALTKISIKNKWQIQVAALLSHIGCVSIPETILLKAVDPESLSENDATIYASHPSIAQNLIRKIPRLRIVSEIVGGQFDPCPEFLDKDIMSLNNKILGIFLLRAAIDVDCLTNSGGTLAQALSSLKSKKQYNNQVLSLFSDLEIVKRDKTTRMEVNVESLTTSMIIDENVYSTCGTLLVSKGQEVTDVVRTSLTTISETQGVKQPIYVLV